MTSLSEQLVSSVCDALADQGYIVLDNALPATLTTQLANYVTTINEAEFSPAAIGRDRDKQHNQHIRNDQTLWLTKGSKLEQDYFSFMDQLRTELNQNLYLGLHDFEAHFAYFKAGSYYQRHLDAFRGKSNRKVSTVFYLNPDWQQAYGGELAIYHPDRDEQLCTVSPKLGTLIIFLSEQFPHEVMPAKKDRYSIAGWFRTDNPVL